jgi:glycosyltransferase involved in cell wall biosynthesis
MLEALAMGIPSVCTDCPVGGARMTIKNNENGILVPVGDTNAMYEGMKKILMDKQFANELSENAIKIRQELAVEKIVGKWLEVLENE